MDEETADPGQERLPTTRIGDVGVVEATKADWPVRIHVPADDPDTPKMRFSSMTSVMDGNVWPMTRPFTLEEWAEVVEVAKTLGMPTHQVCPGHENLPPNHVYRKTQLV